MPSTSRTPFDSSTPSYPTFDATVLDYPQDPNASVPIATRTTTARRDSWLRKSIGRTREVVGANIGLLLVASAQLFFALMNVGVKELNSLDPPVPAVEVETNERVR